MKVTVGIMTLNGYSNYGNRLQNYALQTFIESFGYNVDTLIYESVPHNMSTINKIKRHLKRKDILISVNDRIKSTFKKNYKLKRKYMGLREVNFKKFTHKYIHETDFSISSDIMSNNKIKKSINDRYTSIFVGSDQVWNYEGKMFPDMYFLPFIDKQKRNSFSASFGFSKIPNKSFNIKYANALLSMNNISVREESGRTIVKTLTNRNCDVLLDPTLLLTKYEWLKISSDSRLKPKEAYIVTYFLGEITPDYQRLIDKISSNNNYKVLKLNDINNIDLFKVSPSEFIDLISNSSFVITDSFHGTVFSIIFHRPFVVVNRVDRMVNMNTRIINLLRIFKLNQCYLDDINKPLRSDYLSVDFSSSTDIIQSNYVSSKKFLLASLSSGINQY